MEKKKQDMKQKSHLQGMQIFTNYWLIPDTAVYILKKKIIIDISFDIVLNKKVNACIEVCI